MDTKAQAAKVVAAQYAAATAAGKALAKRGELAVSATYEPRQKRLHVELASGVGVSVPISKIQGLAGAKPRVAKTVEITGKGYGLYWPSIDLDISVPDLVAGCLGTKTWMRTLAQHAGRATSAAKGASSRENGKKGGRPRKAPAAVLEAA